MSYELYLKKVFFLLFCFWLFVFSKKKGEEKKWPRRQCLRTHLTRPRPPRHDSHIWWVEIVHSQASQEIQQGSCQPGFQV